MGTRRMDWPPLRDLEQYRDWATTPEGLQPWKPWPSEIHTGSCGFLLFMQKEQSQRVEIKVKHFLCVDFVLPG